MTDWPLTTPARPVGRGVLSTLADDELGAPYDRRAAVYDRLVGMRVYNRLAWATSPADYAEFAARATASADGPLLDVACGSAGATAATYRASGRPCLLVDRSVGMLERAADRLGGAPDVTLLQADVDALPLAPATFATVVLFGGLHLFVDLATLAGTLRAQLAPGGRLFVTGLAAETRVGRAYLALLHRAGEVAEPRSAATLRAAVEHGFGAPLERWERRGSMCFGESAPA